MTSLAVEMKTFRGFRAPKKLWLIILENNDLENGTKHNFTGCITLSKVKLKYSEEKFKKAKFN